MQPTTIDTNIGRIRKAFALMTVGAASLPGPGFAATDIAQLPRNLSPWGMFVNADIVVQAVMVGLAVASLITWTVWLAKTIEMSRATSIAKRRLAQLESERLLADAEHDSRDGRDAVAQIIQSAARESSLSDGVIDDGFKERIALRLERVEAAMSRRIARGTGVLATIGATAPFVGLFGTVWGIMSSFQAIAVSKNTNLAVVAPGIAEALFATALGLVAAIPAVIFYNKFSADSAQISHRLEAFADEFAAIVSRQIDVRT